MNQQTKDSFDLNDVLHQILLEAETRSEPFDRRRLEVWTTRFPNFKREIIEFFVQEILLDNLPDPTLTAAEETAFTEQSRNVLAKILTEQRAVRAAAAYSAVNIQSLQSAAAQQNLNVPQLARIVGLSRQLLISLEQRMVKPTTISQKLKIRLAAALSISIESLNAYFEQPAGFLPGASYKSAEQPQLGEQQDFAELIKKDLKLTAEQKRALLD